MSLIFKTKKQAGFSLLELIVVLAIFSIMTGILVADIPNFREKSSLDLTASEVATYIRGAQVYGAAQRGGGDGMVAYGIHFERGSSNFYLFKNNYSPTVVEEAYTLNGFKIVDILVRYGERSDQYICRLSKFETLYQANKYQDSIGTNFEARFSAKTETGSTASLPGFDYADIKIQNLRNPKLEACLRIYRNGQIITVNCQDQSFNKCS